MHILFGGIGIIDIVCINKQTYTNLYIHILYIQTNLQHFYKKNLFKLCITLHYIYIEIFTAIVIISKSWTYVHKC